MRLIDALATSRQKNTLMSAANSPRNAPLSGVSNGETFACLGVFAFFPKKWSSDAFNGTNAI